MTAFDKFTDEEVRLIEVRLDPIREEPAAKRLLAIIGVEMKIRQLALALALEGKI